MGLYFHCVVLILCQIGVVQELQSEAAPDGAVQARILASVRKYAHAYQLPYLVFDQVKTIYDDGQIGKWHILNFNCLTHGGVEYWRHAGKNGKVYRGEKWRMDKRVYDDWFRDIGRDDHGAMIRWDRWYVVRGHRCGVLVYQVDRVDSKCRFERHAAKPPVANQGDMCVDPDSGAIWHISRNPGSSAATGVGERFGARG